ncbi:MAG: cysteine-S-conjugate beta-lyase [Acidimicrobiia bacterium]|nr:cysteine-S-conjugate beta-lyase [Acidimicrobiia bacterium]
MDDADASSPFDAIDEHMLRRRRGAKWQRYGPYVLPAWVADMDFAPPPPITRALAEMLHCGDLGYPWLGEPNEVAVAFSAWATRRYGWTPNPDKVLVTVDVLQPLTAVIELFSQPGDGVIITTPIYPPFLSAIDLTGRVLIDNPLGPAAEGYPLDLDGLRAAAADNGRAKILLLCNPHNPSGRVFDDHELRALATAADELDLIVVSDEIHADLIYPGRRHRPFATVSDTAAARTVTLTSATKSFSIAGLRLAVAHFGSDRLLSRYQSFPRLILGGANGPGAAATLAAWREGDAWLDQLVRYLDGNRRLVHDFVADKLPGCTHRLPEATYLAWIDCRQLVEEGLVGSGQSPAAFFLEQARVGLNDGADFGRHGQGFVRLNFATSRAILQQVLDRMADALARS